MSTRKVWIDSKGVERTVPPSKMVRILVEVPQDWKPIDGTPFDAVRDALDFAEVPAWLQVIHE